MRTIEYRFIDKSKWARGPWDTEPDKAQWPDLETGLPCLIVRNDFGALCGYVGVSEDHPFYMVNYDDRDRDLDSIEVHGGLTFSDFCADREKEHGVCHIPDAGEPDNVWWIGFDCNHYLDHAPGLHASRGFPTTLGYKGTVYRDLAFVRSECARLAAQLAESYRKAKS